MSIKYTIFTREDTLSQAIEARLLKKLEAINFIRDDKNPRLVFTVGGDGTVLKAFQQVHHMIDDVIFCGIFSGTLGFYTDYEADQLDELIHDLVHKEIEQCSYSLLDVKVVGKTTKSFLALNECRIENNISTEVIDLFVDNDLFETFKGNGLCISTPTGSTAYNKSLGGAIIHPSTKAMQICEIAPLNNVRYRTLNSALVLTDKHFIELKGNFSGAFLGVDQKIVQLNEFDHIEVKISSKHINFVHFNHLPFLRRVKRSFITNEPNQFWLFYY